LGKSTQTRTFADCAERAADIAHASIGRPRVQRSTT
jgi:hypothetical protein